MTLVVDIGSHAVIDVHCTTRKTTIRRSEYRSLRGTPSDLQVLLVDKGYDSGDFRDYLRENGVRPLIKYREFTSLHEAQNAQMDPAPRGQRQRQKRWIGQSNSGRARM